MEGKDKRLRDAAVLHHEPCLAFVQKLWEADKLAMFHHPVSATEVPGYHEVIEEPMDLTTIRRKIEANTYTTDAEVEDDVALMLSNALDFNARDTPWHDLAKQIKKRYPAMAAEVGLVFDADGVFIPTKKTRDDESTLRKAEKQGGEKLEEVLETMEKEKEIPLEELRAKYARNAVPSSSSRSSGAGQPDVSLDDDDDDSSSVSECLSSESGADEENADGGDSSDDEDDSSSSSGSD